MLTIKRRQLGRTQLMVTELGFGAMNLRLLDTYDEAYEILNFVLDQGVNFIDTARAYNGKTKQGEPVESEYLVGRAIERRTDLTEPIVIVTKGHGYTVPALEEHLNTSLEKLGVKGKGTLRIGNNEIKLVYFLHGINKERWDTISNSGVLERLQQLRQEGVINYLGFSSHYPNGKEIKAAIDTGIFDVVELPYNIYNRSLGEDAEQDMLAYAHEKGLGIVNMKAFGGNGMLSIQKILQDVVEIDYATMLNFCLSNPYITTVDAGAKYVSEFSADIKTAVGPRLSGDRIEALKQEADKVSPHMRSVCRECMHCMEKFSCPQDVDFPSVLAIYSRYMIGDKLGKDTSEFKRQYEELDVDIDACIECGECLPWCEYDLQIPTMLREAQEAFDS